MAENIKPLVIKLRPDSGQEPNGTAYKWASLTSQMNSFTKAIQTPKIAVDKDGKSTVNIGTIVSGMPTIFARANLFKLALDIYTDKNSQTQGLLDLYKVAIDEWRGFIACIALDYANLDIERIYLNYSDGKSVLNTGNIYEPKGAFGNLLFERKPVWCDQKLSANDDKIPFIDVIKYKGETVGGTSPDSFLFTSVAYHLNEKQPFISVYNGKFTDPLNSDLTPEQIRQLYGYVNYIISNLNDFKEYYKELPKNIQPEITNLSYNLTNWVTEIAAYATKRALSLKDSSTPPVDRFKKPFSILFNFSLELYGSEGSISETPDGLQHPITFDPRKLLLSNDAEIASIDFGNEAAKNPDYLKQQPIIFLKAEIKGMPGVFKFFALPMSPLGLNIFGKNLKALVGHDQDSSIRSRLTAVYDPNSSLGVGNLSVRLYLYTINGKEKTIDEVYNVNSNQIHGPDIIIWPNFISKQWSKYYMFSEMPHNATSKKCPFKATPFVGDIDDDFFRILVNKDGVPVYLSKDGNINIPNNFEERIKAQLMIISDNRVADNDYKYEIYESNQPFKGVRLSYTNKESGFIIIKYSTHINDGLPNDYLHITKDLAEANLGIDFGSTNSSVAYYSKRDNKVVDEIILKDKRVSLLYFEKKNNENQPARLNEIFFFQNDEIKTNAIKSILTIHDRKRLVEESGKSSLSQAIKGGFPCFEKNLPIESATENRYQLFYPTYGIVDIVYNMKWSNQDEENAYKKAYLGSLLMHVYAYMFEDGHIPITLKWSYPSSMGQNLLVKYIQIWDSLGEVNPINGGKKLNIYKPSFFTDYDLTGSKVFAEKGWGDGYQPPPSSNWNTVSSESSPWGNKEPNASPSSPTSGWGNQIDSSLLLKEIKTETNPVKFNFKKLGADECLSEACAVANFIVGQNTIQNTADYLTLCFDVGGSSTDISALCTMKGPNGSGVAMVKQNSIRFAAQRVSYATKVSRNFKLVLQEMCNRKNITLQGLNAEPSKFSADTAPYFFEQIVDRLYEQDFPIFYELIRGKCPELMSINIYVTGLIMFYSGQLAYKLIQEIIKSEDKHPAMMNDWRPKVNIVFAGKGARIFDWFTFLDQAAANKYYTDLFISGFGGLQNAQKCLFAPPIINPTNKDGSSNIKYEVSKGLALPTESLLVPQNMEAIEILGEEGFIVLNQKGEKVNLPYDSSLTAEMMETLGSYFYSSPSAGKSPCPKFMDFAGVFYQVASSLFGLKMTPDDFMVGFKGMNINSYIKTLPEYYAAVEGKQKGGAKQFDFVAPIIILEGMKFYDDYLLKGISK